MKPKNNTKTDEPQSHSTAGLGDHYTQRISKKKDYHGSYGWTYETEDRDVILLAISGQWAMVRRKGCMPYVCSVKDLSPNV